MSKLTYEDKKEIIRLYKEEHYGCSYLSKQFNINIDGIKLLIRKYNIHGEDALKKTHKIVTPEIKLEIINRAKSGKSKKSLAVEYLVTAVQINNWLKQYEELGYDGLKNKKKGRPPNMKKEVKPVDPNDKDAVIKQLQERNLELECEVEALKKLRALVQQRNAQQTKKKQ